MKLIMKKSGRLFRFLTDDESEALRARHSHAKDVVENEGIVKKLLAEMKSNDLWLLCDCKAMDEPVLIARQMDNGIRLANKQGGGLHAVGCVMERYILPAEKGEGSGDILRKPFVKVGYDKIIPRSGETEATKSHGKRDGNSKTGRKRYSSIARLMLQLLDDAKINYSELPLNKHSGSTIAPPKALSNLLASTEYYPGRMLDEVVRLDYRLKVADLERLMTELENKAWKKNEAATFWVMFRSTDVRTTGAYVEFNGNKYPFEPTRGMSINGEHKDGVRESYWVITRFVRDQITKNVVCRDGYAHAIYSTEIPIPIDSNLERDTMNSLSEIAGWGKRKGITEIKMHKPLFDIMVKEEGDLETGIIPDFVVTVESGYNRLHTIVIETTGYVTQEYIDRKTRQHELMKQLGELLTDPPDWPYSRKSEFKKVLAKYIFHPDVRAKFNEERPSSNS
ncbi:hypothetical protein QD671_004065 [Salmonella enterica]|nr:hypothetical protein [Salmonella enterica subsp. enterica serovar Newport]EJT9668144.1 hypothetical protein [Salmonella enterica]EKT1274918.1 hypothetical protein [Salmonella enterica]EKT1784180.1 hypothetical protein [Salmonella enterica]EKT2131375.1 hypothetical protein [Salmonella enterica]